MMHDKKSIIVFFPHGSKEYREIIIRDYYYHQIFRETGILSIFSKTTLVKQI